MALGMAGLVAVSWLRYRWSGTLDLDRAPFDVPLEVVTRVLMGACLLPLVTGWLRLGHEDLPEAAASTLVRWALGLCGVAACALPLTSNDVFSNLAYGHMVHLGLDISRLGPNALPDGDVFRAMVTPRWLDSPCVYGPVTTWTFYLATFSRHVWVAFVAYKLLFAAVGVLVVMAARLAVEAVATRGTASRQLVLTAVNPLVIWEIAGQGHNDGVMVWLSLLAVAFVARGNVVVALAAMTAAVLTKSAVAPALALFVFFSLGALRERFYWALCGVAGTVAAVAVWTSPKLAMTLGMAGDVAHLEPRLINSVGYLVFTIARLAGDGVGLGVYRAFWLASAVLLAALGVVYGRAARSPQAVSAGALRLLLLMALVFSPNLQPWYFTWLVPFVVGAEPDGLSGFVAWASMAFFALYPIQQSVPSSLLAAAALVLLWRDGRAFFRPLTTAT